MDLTSDFPYWTVRNGLIRPYPPLETDSRCDVLVVGGGITGALLANELRTRGIECIVLDRRDIGHGSTSASTALLLYEVDTPLPELIEKVGRSHAERAYRLGVDAILQMEGLAQDHAGFRRHPCLKLTKHRKDLPALHAEFLARRHAGISVRWLDRDALRQRYGIDRDGAIQSSVAAEVDPYLLAHHLFQKLGDRVYDRTEVVHYQATRSGITAQTDRGFKVRAKAVFFATGLETANLLPKNLVQIRSTYALVTEPLRDLSFWHRGVLIWETGDPYLYARTTSDRRIIIGGEDDHILQPSRRDSQLPHKTKRLERALGRLFPKQETETAFSWAGSFGSTRDGLPYIGRFAGFSRGYFALGFGGNGITFSVMASRILADLFEGKKTPDAEIFRFDR